MEYRLGMHLKIYELQNQRTGSASSGLSVFKSGA